jgi:hypothetical protein
MNSGDWVSTKEAIGRLKNHSEDPPALLLSLLREGSVSARSSLIKRDGEVVEEAPFLRRNSDKSNRLDANFWFSVSDSDWFIGRFALVRSAPPELFGHGETLCWSANNVELNWLEVIKQVGPVPTTVEITRAPSFKSGRPPTDKQILDMAYKLKARGLDGRTIAREMRLEPGFENVATTAVRNLIKTRWPVGRPKKAP